MSLVPNDVPRDPDRLLQQLQQMTEVIAAQNASFLSLQAKHVLFWPSVTRRRPRSRSFGC
jgi:hypothetical protein